MGRKKKQEAGSAKKAAVKTTKHKTGHAKNNQKLNKGGGVRERDESRGSFNGGV